MSASQNLYSTYLLLRCHLADWKPGLLPAEVMNGLAGEAIADLVEKGLAGQITHNGPYAEAFSTMSRLVNLMCPTAWEGEPAVWTDEIPRPTVDFAKEVAQAYGALFDIAFDAKLTYNDVLLIKALIATGAPPNEAEATLAELITLGSSQLEPLRRAFWSCEEHEPNKGPVCKFSGRIIQRESMASERWLDRKTREEMSTGWRV